MFCLHRPSIRRLNTRVYLRLYVPDFASSLSVSVADCSSGDGLDGGNCPLVLRIGSVSLQHGPVTVNCSGTTCSAALSNPPWDTWLRVDVESSRDNRSVTFAVVSNYTGDRAVRRRHTCARCSLLLHLSASVGCKPASVGLSADDDLSKLRGNIRRANSSSAPNASPVAASGNKSTPLSASACVWNIPVLQEELDVLSLRFTPVNGPNVSVTHTHPTLLSYPLNAQASGGTLNVQLTLNTVSSTSTEI